jgi:hypothetical protein
MQKIPGLTVSTSMAMRGIRWLYLLISMLCCYEYNARIWSQANLMSDFGQLLLSKAFHDFLPPPALSPAPVTPNPTITNPEKTAKKF